MKYKEGDKVLIKDIDWYNEHKDETDDIECSNNIWFYREMSKFCGKVMTISHVRVDHYTMVEDLVGFWTDEMIEDKVDDKNSLTLVSTRTVLEYTNEHATIWLEIYEDDPTTCIFTHLLVDEKYRQQGYGTQALSDAEMIAKNHGCDEVYLKVENGSWMYDWYLRRGYEFDNFDTDGYVWLYKEL